MEGKASDPNINLASQFNAAWEKIEKDNNLKPTAITVYWALFQINNKSFWKPVFNATFGQVLSMTGIGNVKTYYSALEELVKNGYIIWNKSSNQYQAATFSLILLYQKKEEQNESADPKKGSAGAEHAEVQGYSTRKCKGNIHKQEDYKQKDDEDEKGDTPSPQSNLYTIHDFVKEIEIGDNEFTLLACRKTGLTQQALAPLLKDFIVEQKALTKITWKNAADARGHFINWACKQPKPEQGTQFTF